MSANLAEARSLALQKIGRNVVNFQRMEALLKDVIALGRIQAPAGKLEEALKERAIAVSTMTMGQLARGAVGTLYANTDSRQSEATAATEVSISVSMTLEGGSEDVDAWKECLASVVNARNHLIHQMLAAFDHNSIESCQALCVTLDEQRAAFAPVHEDLIRLVRGLREAYGDLARTLSVALDQVPVDGASGGN